MKLKNNINLKNIMSVSLAAPTVALAAAEQTELTVCVAATPAAMCRFASWSWRQRSRRTRSPAVDASLSAGNRLIGGFFYALICCVRRCLCRCRRCCRRSRCRSHRRCHRRLWRCCCCWYKNEGVARRPIKQTTPSSLAARTRVELESSANFVAL